MVATPKDTHPPSSANIRTTIYLSDADRHTLASIQDRYGLPTMSAALRYAVHRLPELEEQVVFLNEQLASLRHELTQVHKDILEIHQEREFMLREMQYLNEEVQRATVTSQTQLSVREWVVLRQRGEHERDAARRMRTWARQVRDDLELQHQRWNETIAHLMARTRNVLPQS